jgi:hypothetical protein
MIGDEYNSFEFVFENFKHLDHDSSDAHAWKDNVERLDILANIRQNSDSFTII